MDANEYRLGSKENPHPAFRTGIKITPVKKDRIKGDYYLVDGELYSCTTNNILRNVEKERKYNKKYKEKNKENIKEYHKEYDKEYREKNKEQLKEKSKEYYQNNTEKIKEKSRKYYQNNTEKINKKNKEYREKNKEQLKEKNKEHREEINKRRRNRRKTDPAYRILCNLRTRIGHALEAQNASKNKRSLEYFNCTGQDFRHYIERLFTDGMNWDNQGKKADDERGWELDHRRPCASFDFTDEEQIHMCFHYTNYQPLWSKDNRTKTDKFDPETFPYEWKGKEIGWVGIYNFGK